ncbi:antitoxin [Tersicoccus sp. MR15.9]|uniref:antitoxin n=1 Tax=Tersicoccus mangrovi TaxID=3121635 RepID=UPI002FE5C914
MSAFDNLKGKASDLMGKAADAVRGHEDQVKQGIEKAGDFIDQKTGGKYADRIDSVQQKAGEAVNRLGSQDHTGGAGTTPGTTPAGTGTTGTGTPGTETPSAPTEDATQPDPTKVDPDLGR